MMNNKKKYQVIAVALTTALIAGGIGYHYYGADWKDNVLVQAAERSGEVNSVEKNPLQNQKVNAALAIADEEHKGLEKEETVYVKASADGTIKNIIVSDWLKNYDKQAKLLDTSDLKNIVNVKGEESYETDADGGLIWNSNGEDIYYQGQTDKELPILVNVEYKLDGNSITSEELIGKSGHLQMRIEFKQNSIKGEKFQPFTIVTAMMLNTEKYTNVSAKNAKVISDGNKLLAVGITLPGLAEELNTSTEITVPEYIEIEADVTEYEANTIYNVATAGLLADLDLDAKDQLDTLNTSMDDLDEAAKQLVEGSNDLSKGVSELSDKTTEFVDGVKSISSGVEEFTDGISKTANGSKELYNGAAKLEEGSTTLATGITGAKSSVGTINEKLGTLESGAKQVSNGAAKMKTATATLKESKENENKAYATLSKTIENNEAIIKALKASGANETIIKQLEENTAGQKQILAGLNAAGGKIAAGLSSLNESMSSLSEGATDLGNGAGALKEGVNSLYTGFDKLEAGSKAVKDGAKGLATGAKSLKEGTAKLDEAAGTLKDGGQKLATASDKLKEGAKSAADGSIDLKNGMKKFYDEGISKLISTYQDDYKAIIDNAKQLLDTSAEYTIFTKASEGTKTSVKFIIEIE